jgi:hypothetical protein
VEDEENKFLLHSDHAHHPTFVGVINDWNLRAIVNTLLHVNFKSQNHEQWNLRDLDVQNNKQPTKRTVILKYKVFVKQLI